jgi:hypothetical protein
VTAALTAAPRTCAAGLYHSEAGTEPIIQHGTFLARPDFAASIANGNPVALREAITTLDNTNLPHLLTAIRHAAGHQPS